MALKDLKMSKTVYCWQEETCKINNLSETCIH